MGCLNWSVCWVCNCTTFGNFNMGNAQARQRIKARDFDYLAKFTGFATDECVEHYFDTLMDKYPDGKMSVRISLTHSKWHFLRDLKKKFKNLLKTWQTRMEKFLWQTC